MFFTQFEKRCKAMGTSPSAVVLKIGLTKANITYWKKGNSPNGDVISKIAKELECSVGYLLGETDDPTPADKKNNAPSGDPKEALRLKLIEDGIIPKDRMLNDAEWDAIIAYAETLLKRRD